MLFRSETTFKDKSVAKWEEAILSYYGRANYDYKSKYMIEGQARYDGSSKFRPENRWAFFWGVSGGWRITEERYSYIGLYVKLSFFFTDNCSIMG